MSALGEFLDSVFARLRLRSLRIFWHVGFWGLALVIGIASGVAAVLFDGDCLDPNLGLWHPRCKPFAQFRRNIGLVLGCSNPNDRGRRHGVNISLPNR
jgi:hypothetical protein